MYRDYVPLSARPFGGVRLYGYCQYVARIDKNRPDSDKKAMSDYVDFCDDQKVLSAKRNINIYFNTH